MPQVGADDIFGQEDDRYVQRNESFLFSFERKKRFHSSLLAVGYGKSQHRPARAESVHFLDRLWRPKRSGTAPIRALPQRRLE